ncbi:MAG: hypothetical protein ABSB33_02750 [Tepidisphaeraceae bacterium]|jgi:hypothetical protein
MRYRLRIMPAAEADVDAAASFTAQNSLQAALPLRHARRKRRG